MNDLFDKFAENTPLQNELLKRNPRQYISNLFDLMKVRRVGPSEYRMIATKGRHELFDYDRGLLFVIARVLEDIYTKSNYVIQLYIGNVDDGEWEAWSKPYSDKDKACKIVEKIAKLMEEWTILPSGDEINEQIREFGLYGK